MHDSKKKEKRVLQLLRVGHKYSASEIVLEKK